MRVLLNGTGLPLVETRGVVNLSWRFSDYALRLVEVNRILASTCLRALFRRMTGRPVQGPTLLREAFERMSGSLLKFGQILALQVDALPRGYCDALMSLLDRVTPFSEKGVEQVFLEELGASPQSIYQSFTYRPLASASIGQVHAATLPDGTRIAVKVQRPGVRKIFERDLALLHLLIRVIFFFRIQRGYFMRDVVREMDIWTHDELDYRVEAAHCQLLKENAAGTATERLPKVHWEFTTRRILTMEFLDGPSVADYLRMRQDGDEAGLAALGAHGFDSQQFCANMIANFLRDAFRHGVFHADLHPANLLILPNNVVGYVDFGIVGALNSEARRKLINLTNAYASGSPDSLYVQFLSVCTVGRNADLPLLRRELERRMSEWYQEPVVAGPVQFRVRVTRTFVDLLNVARCSGVLVDRAIIKYIRSIYLADGLIQRLAPGFELAGILRKVLEEYALEAGRKRIFSTAGAVSLLTNMAMWLETNPGDFAQVLSTPERIEAHTHVTPVVRETRPLRRRAAAVAGVWALSVVLVVYGERVWSFMAVLTAGLVTSSGRWFAHLWSG
jgi:ubiquinone biosynthesis protein